MAEMGIARLDELYDGATGASPITQADSGEVVEVVQELIRNHDLRKVPGPKHVSSSAVPPDPDAETFGSFGKYTKKALKYFQDIHGIPQVDPPIVDTMTLRRLIQTKTKTPTPGRAYLTRKLDFEDGVILRVLILICGFEEHASFGGFKNWKPQETIDADQTGLSFGILQWTHAYSRLGDLLERFNQLSPLFQSKFGVTPQEATEMIAHAKAGKAVLLANGDPVPTVPPQPSTTHLNFQKETVQYPWKSRFVAAGDSIPFQIFQVEQALKDLRGIHTRKKAQWTKITSNRGWGFMLDLANQRGEDGANRKYNAAIAALPAGTESQILEHIETNEVNALYKARRRFFRVDTPLANTPFPENP